MLAYLSQCRSPVPSTISRNACLKSAIRSWHRQHKLRSTPKPIKKSAEKHLGSIFQISLQKTYELLIVASLLQDHSNCQSRDDSALSLAIRALRSMKAGTTIAQAPSFLPLKFQPLSPKSTYASILRTRTINYPGTGPPAD